MSDVDKPVRTNKQGGSDRGADLVRRLAEVGLQQDEAALYVELSGRGPSTAAHLARAAGFSRPRAYRALDGLGTHGFVTSRVGRPRVFEAATPDIVLGTLRMRAQAMVENLEKAHQELGPPLMQLRSQQAVPEPTAPHFSVIRGRNSLAGHALNLYETAATNLDLLLTPPGRNQVFDRARPERVAQRATEGVDVRILLAHRSAEAPSPGLTVGLPPVPTRWIQAEQLSTTILADAKELLSLVSSDPRKEQAGPLGFRSNAAELVSTQQLLFNRLWDGAAPVANGKARKK